MRRPSCSRSTATRSPRRAALADAVEGDYARYEFHLVVQRLQTFCSEDLGGFYLDVLKDRLYTAGTTSRARRSAQTALALIRDTLLKLMAPVLSFTAEEAWRIVHPQDADDLHPGLDRNAAGTDPTPTALVEKWSRILAVRAAVQKEIEALRQTGEVGSSLQAEVAITAPRRRLRRAGEPRRRPALRDDHVGRDRCRRSRARGGGHRRAARKCDRCWHYRADVGADPAHPTICGALRRESLRRAAKRAAAHEQGAPGCGWMATGSALSAVVVVADQATKAIVKAWLAALARCVRSAAFSASSSPTTTAPRSASAPARAAGSAGCSWRSPSLRSS